MYGKSKLVMLISLSLLMAGCESVKVFDSGCEWTTYITASQMDTEETKRQILTHDLVRKEKCEE